MANVELLTIPSLRNGFNGVGNASLCFQSAENFDSEARICLEKGSPTGRIRELKKIVVLRQLFAKSLVTWIAQNKIIINLDETCITSSNSSPTLTWRRRG